MRPGQGILACFSLSGPNIVLIWKTWAENRFHLPFLIFYYGERIAKLCLTVDVKLTTMHPGQGIMVYFSLSGSNILLHL